MDVCLSCSYHNTNVGAPNPLLLKPQHTFSHGFC
uniref:Uncharacterized protein n=1 Tax=Arundo donax TaxID=35708 RepID=A0A0A9AMB3_ARUDO